MAFIALLLRIVSNPLANVFEKKLTAAGVSASLVNFGAYAVAFFAGCIAVWLCGANCSFAADTLAACLRVGILGATGNFFLVKALEYGELSVLGPINSYKALFGMLFAFFVLGECPDVLGFCGVAVMVVGSYFVIGFGGGFKFSAAEGRAVLYRILALVFSALESVFIKEVINASSAEFGFAAWAGAGMLFSLPLLLIPQRGRVSGAAFCAANLKMLLAAGACVSVMQLSTNWVFASIQVGYALALFQLSSVLSVIFGMLFFGEKHIARKLFGSALMCAGAVLIL